MSEGNTLISIENYNGTKYIHYLGYGYMSEAVKPGKPARIVEYTGLICPLEKALKHGLSVWETDNSEGVTQYLSDVTEHELDEYLSAHPYVRESEIALENLHCGTYFMIPRK